MLEGSDLTTESREIVTTRLFEAPRDLVFEAWTRPEHLARWWGPRGFTTTVALAQTFASVEDRDRTIGFGAKAGSCQSWDRLAELLAKMGVAPS